METLQQKTASMLTAYLANLGFDAMAKECKKETNIETLKQYARIVVKNIKNAQTKYEVSIRFKKLALI